MIAYFLPLLSLLASDPVPANARPRQLLVTRSDGSQLVLNQSTSGRWQAVPFPHPQPAGPHAPIDPQPFCNDGVLDTASTSCLQASSVPALGMLLPLGNGLVVTSSGYVGIGTNNPNNRLVVQGLLQSTSGGLRFADDTTLSSATLVGPPGTQGIPGPMGPMGNPGPQGPQGPLSALPSINGRTGALTFAVAGYATISTSTSAHTVTIGVGPVLCDWNGKKYSQWAKCYINPTQSGCGTQWTATDKTCQANGTWSTGSVLCRSHPPGPLCGQ